MKVTQSELEKECVLYTNKNTMEPIGITPHVKGYNVFCYGQRVNNFMIQPTYMTPDNDYNNHVTKVMHFRTKDFTGISKILKTEKDKYEKTYTPEVTEIITQDEPTNELLFYYLHEGEHVENYLALNNISNVNLGLLQSVYDPAKMTYNTYGYGSADGMSIDTGISNKILDGLNLPYMTVRNKSTKMVNYTAYAEMIFGYSRYSNFADRKAAARSTNTELSKKFTPFLVLPMFSNGWPRSGPNNTFYGYWSGTLPSAFVDYWGASMSLPELNKYNVTHAQTASAMKMKQGGTYNGTQQPYCLYYARCCCGGNLPISSSTVDNSRTVGIPALAVKGHNGDNYPLIHHMENTEFYHSFSLLDIKLAVTIGAKEQQAG